MMKSRILLLCVGLCFGVAKYANSQDLTGFTSIDFDYGSDLVIGYSETDLDYTAQGDYEAFVSCFLRDDNQGIDIASAYDQDDGATGYASVLVEAYGNPGTSYTAFGNHRA